MNVAIYFESGLFFEVRMKFLKNFDLEVLKILFSTCLTSAVDPIELFLSNKP
jgi:hypothetical protein